MSRCLVTLWLLAVSISVSAQGVLNDEYGASLPDMDATLFHTYIPEVDPYSEVTKYYRPQLSQRRRGLDWWVADDLIEPVSSVAQVLGISVDVARLRLYGSTKDYRAGIAGEYATTLRRGWSVVAKADARIGEDANIEGVFREDIRAELSLSRAFSNDHYLSFSLNAPFLTRGLQSDASQEAITLTGDNLYNPSWGIYDGEVRNSRVSKYMIPKLTTRYQLPLGSATIASLTMVSEYGRRSISRLGWYDGYNPTPDYYRKLPSYIESGDLHSAVEQLWRDNDLSYTQIAWDDLVAVNQLSPTGEAHYVVEDQAERVANTDIKLLLSSDVGDGVKLIYGLRGYGESSRNFKQMDDLLGGEFLYDHDLFIGDYAHLGNDMQNDLRNPDRKVVVGDRFGYDYTIRSLSAAMVLGVEYRQGCFSVVARGEFGQRSIERIGHYEKERFAGELSYGSSGAVSMAENMVDLRVGYSPTGRHHLWLRGLQRDLPMDADDLFLQVQNANRVVDNPTPRSISSINLGYRYQSPNFSLDVEGYVLYSRKEKQVWSYYDDLTYTYSDVVVSDISTRSIGVDIVGSYSISRRLKWDFAIAIGDYTYDKTPTVSLYSDVDMSLYSTSEARAVNGCKVGNAPQYLATSSLTFFVDYGLILSLDSSFGGGRYIAPSFVRRSDRVVLSSSSPEMANSIIAQESMSAVIDITPSITKILFLRYDRQLSLNFRINNLLGVSDNIEYGREGNRIYTTSGGSDTGSRYLEPNSYIYGNPRTFYLSCGYRF